MFRECECCAKAKDCVEVNVLYLCRDCVQAYEWEFESIERDKDLAEEDKAKEVS